MQPSSFLLFIYRKYLFKHKKCNELNLPVFSFMVLMLGHNGCHELFPNIIIPNVEIPNPEHKNPEILAPFQEHGEGERD
jgi:hypothetical protein